MIHHCLRSTAVATAMTCCSIFQWKEVRLSLSAHQHPAFLEKWGRSWLHLSALLGMLYPQPTFTVTLWSFQVLLFVIGRFTLVLFIPENELTREWMTKRELCQMIKPFRRQAAPGDQILKSVLPWELNSIDGGVFRCHLWAQFFWHGTSLSSLFARQQRAETRTIRTKYCMWGLQSSVDYLCFKWYIYCYLSSNDEEAVHLHLWAK